MSRMKAASLVAIGIAVGSIAGYFLPLPHSHSVFSDEERERGHAFRYISPLLACGEGEFNHLGNDETKDLEAQLSELVALLKEEEKLKDAGIYFRQLSGGPWVGVNSDTEFAPGSLLKVPLAMSVFEHATERPGLLDEQILFEGGTAGANEYFASARIEPGTTYSVRDLVRATLVHSDNDAALLLAQVVGESEVLESYARLGVKTPVYGSDYSTTVRDYASFFRILYNGTYLSHERSEELLAILADSTFDQGIAGGLPEGTVVAHKFGERSLGPGQPVQLHDCGIVYAPKTPYMLCVMMRGRDFETLASAIRAVSEEVWESVTR